jgi:hypothetical protein
MKYFLPLIVFLLAFEVFASSEWKILAETVSCSEKIQILGKEGEKYVLLKKNSEEIKLFSKDGSAFKLDDMQSTEFSSNKYSYIHPGYVEGNPPKIDLNISGTKKRCRMQLAE